MGHRIHYIRGVLLGGLLVGSLLEGGVLCAPDATAEVVTSLADPGDGVCMPAECTLREAIASAAAGETITFAPALFAAGAQTIVLTAGEVVLDKDLTIVGPDSRLLRLRGTQTSRVVRVATSVTARLENVTITGGRARRHPGGGVLNEGILTLRQSTVRDNYARHGGGVYNTGTLTLVQSTVRGNSADDGGGMHNTPNGSLTVRYSTVSSNTAGRFGGGLSNKGMVTLQHSTLSGNTAEAGGGLSNKGMVTLQHSTVSANTATYIGGGIYNTPNGSLTVRYSTLSGNTAIDGGGIDNYGRLTLQHSTLSGNTADYGGGIYNNNRLTLQHSTVSANTATYTGGGIHNYGTVKFATTILAGNRAGSGGTDCTDVVGGSIQSQGHNLVSAGTGCPSDVARGDVTVNRVVVFTQVLGPLRDNGGPTWTHALRPGSPALDTGNPAPCGATDQRGVPRPQGAGCDIGAFEREVP